MIKVKSKILDGFAFKEAKEELCGHNQLILSEKDIAFLNENNGQIFINSNNVSIAQLRKL